MLATITGGLRPLSAAATTDSVSAVGAKSSQAQNSIAAASLKRWRTTRQLSDAMAALGAASLANSTDPQLPEARYNLAAALDATSISLGEEARKAWQEYLLVDSTSDRALEVRRHLNQEDKSKTLPALVSAIRPPSRIWK